MEFQPYQFAHIADGQINVRCDSSMSAQEIKDFAGLAKQQKKALAFFLMYSKCCHWFWSTFFGSRDGIF